MMLACPVTFLHESYWTLFSAPLNLTRGDNYKHFKCIGVPYNVNSTPLAPTSAEQRCMMLACPVTFQHESYWTFSSAPTPSHEVGQLQEL